MEAYQWAVLMCGIVIFLIVCSIISNRRRKQDLIFKIKKEWGQLCTKKLSNEELEQISHFFENYSEGENVIDDITWHDLDMDRIFRSINNTHSSVGQECLYRMMRVLTDDSGILNDRERKINYFAEHEDERVKTAATFAHMGYCRSISYFDYVYMLSQISPNSNISHIMANVFNIVSLIILIFFNAPAGIGLLILSIGYSVGSYYKMLADIKPYFSCIKIIVRMLDSSRDLRKLNISVLDNDCEALAAYEKELGFLSKNSVFLSSSASVDGSIASVVMDYLKMFTHIDIIVFNNIISKMQNLTDSVIGFSKIMGDIESCMAIASFRAYMDSTDKQWTRPVLNSGTNMFMSAKELTHPLIENAVANSIIAERGVLITGSNASGKSTFIKTVAINAILAQTINTVCAQSYEANFCRVYTSMALKDNLEGNESYYMVEIRSLKRILDACSNTEMPVLCMVDEVLRGTNTIERIAASSQILKTLSRPHILMFAATHDIELTDILKDCYDNYHFQEEVSENDVIFNYRLYQGPATTRNAIKLLKIMGYDDDIVNKADALANDLIKKN